jgi:hypothetical protein
MEECLSSSVPKENSGGNLCYIYLDNSSWRDWNGWGLRTSPFFPRLSPFPTEIPSTRLLTRLFHTVSLPLDEAYTFICLKHIEKDAFSQESRESPLTQEISESPLTY